MGVKQQAKRQSHAARKNMFLYIGEVVSVLWDSIWKTRHL